MRLNILDIVNDPVLDQFNQNIQNVQRLYFHSYCPDGILGRNFLLKHIQFKNRRNPKFLYPFAPYDKISVIPDALFVDCCPASDLLKDFLDCGARVLDHHASRYDELMLMKEQYPDQIIFGDNEKSESGAVLAYKVSVNHSDIFIPDEKEAAELAGIADCFTKEDPRFDHARAQALLLHQLGNSYYDIPSYHDLYLADMMFKTDQVRTKACSKNCILREMHGFKVAFYNGGAPISDLAEVLRQEGVNLIVGYEHMLITSGTESCEAITVSLRSDETINARTIASYYMGGGHDRAAGFRTYHDSNIYELIDQAIRVNF
jgi:hypothetical protein